MMMERSDNIFGPYTDVKQLTHAEKQFNEPNQGGLVETATGGWYFLTHHGSGDWSGRVMSLLPVTWIDGWPIIGQLGADGIGRMAWSGKMPVKGTIATTPHSNDEFKESTLPPQWEWNYQPRAEKWSLKDKPGWLRLYAFKPLQTGNILKAGNTLTQRVFRTLENEVVIKMDISAMVDGQNAGLAHFGSPNYASVGVVCQGSTRYLTFNVKGAITVGDSISANIIWFKSVWGLDGASQFYYSLDGKVFIQFGATYQLAWGAYRGRPYCNI